MAGRTIWIASLVGFLALSLGLGFLAPGRPKFADDPVRVSARIREAWTYWTLTVDPNRDAAARAALQEHRSDWPGTWRKRLRAFVVEELKRRGMCGSAWSPEGYVFRMDLAGNVDVQVSGVCPTTGQISI